MLKNFMLILLATLATWACQPQKKDTALPIMGRREVVMKEVNGQQVADTVYHKVGDFSFVNQDSATVTNATFADKIYVADFFFTTCPTICPLMKDQMLRVYKRFKDNPQVAILSHTIDPEADSVGRLREYAGMLGVTSNSWHFVTGPKQKIYDMGQKNYMVTAYEDANAEGGFMHSGTFILVDKDRHIRGMYDGLNKASVDKLMADMELLLQEYGPAGEQANL